MTFVECCIDLHILAKIIIAAVDREIARQRVMAPQGACVGNFDIPLTLLHSTE